MRVLHDDPEIALAVGNASVLYEEGLFDPALWFPYYLLLTRLPYSAGTLYFYKRR